MGSVPITARIRLRSRFGMIKPRAGFHLLGFAEFGEAGGACATNHFARGAQRRSCDVQIVLVVLGKILNLRALRRREQEPGGFFLSPGVAFILRRKCCSKTRDERKQYGQQKNGSLHNPHRTFSSSLIDSRRLLPPAGKQGRRMVPQNRQRECPVADLGSSRSFCMISSREHCPERC